MYIALSSVGLLGFFNQIHWQEIIKKIIKLVCAREVLLVPQELKWSLIKLGCYFSVLPLDSNIISPNIIVQKA